MQKTMFSSLLLSVMVLQSPMLNAQSIQDFIKDNPKRSAIYLSRNDTLIAELNSYRIMPLASTVKILIAIEYAQQVSKGLIKPTEKIDSAELDKYYIANTDGGAHPAWLNDMQKRSLIKNKKVSLEEIAKGMIRYSSNANTEFLMDKLGLDNINANIKSLGLQFHQKIYPFTSALYLIQNRTAPQVEAIPMEAYIAGCNIIHNKLKANPKEIKSTFRDIPMEVQKAWSDRLPGSTAKEYATIMKKINSRAFFDDVAQKNLDILLEGIMENPANRKWLKHAGMKGGSTSFVLTKAMYATTTKGDKTELAYFFNDLNPDEQTMLQKNMNTFELNILSNEKERKIILETIQKAVRE